MNEIVQIISTLGFPIACAIALGWYVVTTNKENNARIDKLQEEHKEEIQKVTEALNNNTLALQRLCDKFDREERNDDGR